MNFHKLFHGVWTAHWHYDGNATLPIAGCKEGGVIRRATYHCCQCGAVKYTEDF